MRVPRLYGHDDPGKGIGGAILNTNSTVTANHEQAAEGTGRSDPAASPAAISLGKYTADDFITKRELCGCFGCSERTLQRMVERFEIPPPTTLAGRKVWIVGRVREWITDAANRKEAEALKDAKRFRVFN